jgi:RHS repeat-associated protein
MTGTLTELLDTVNYTYGDADWGDLLTAYDGQAITYDGIGNPLYDGFWTYTWEHGRQLSTIGFTGNLATFTYNADGLRIAKNFNNHRTVKYVYNGSQVTQVTVTDTRDETVNYTLRIGYDALGSPLTVNFNGTTYFYTVNLQGDVIAILDTEGNAVVTYTYDAWGHPTGGSGSLWSTLGCYNPLRYRGYVYDFETGLYYLQSRYYNPQTGRFLNADGYTSTSQCITDDNMFAYCDNNPVR